MDQNNSVSNELGSYIFPHETFLCHVFNTCLYQHPEENVRNLIVNNHFQFQFHLDQFYFCLTGIKKGLYHNHYGIHSSVYVDIFHGLKEEIVALCKQHFWCCDVFLVWKEDEKQIAILMSPEKNAQFTAENLSVEIDRLVQQKYEVSIFKGDTHYRNVTSLSMPLQGLHGIRTGYQQVRALGNLSFFRMDGCILTDKAIEQYRNDTDYSVILDACFTLRDLAVDGRDMMALGLRGRQIGETLDALLTQVAEGELPNEKAVLMAWVRARR